MDSEQPLNERQGDLPSPKPREAAGQKSWLIIGIGVITVVLIVAVVAILFLVRWPPESNLPHVSTSAQQIAKCPGACCPDGWVGYRGKCYYFSDAEGTWNSSQSFCSSFNASLAGIDTEKDLMFIMRYKGISEHWIGLKRVSDQSWQWVNSKQFNNLFPVRGKGDCVYLSDSFATSSWCHTQRYWICSKPDGMPREDVMPGG
ncbi:C-type lectin domain family 2 member B-like isoform X1 [Pelodiscus sinensis]|uniref:C-type lectin domain family 2 member B-like isoform X1 n=1 Tax=Pelodiscus sinensis TaxID=13735 RepID=UPI003F6C4966